jgi:hypothetical protein
MQRPILLLNKGAYIEVDLATATATIYGGVSFADSDQITLSEVDNSPRSNELPAMR